MNLIPTPPCYAPGTIHGCYVVLAESKKLYPIIYAHGTTVHRHRIEVKCLTCGIVAEVQQCTLTRSARSRKKTCKACADTRKKPTFRDCPQCADLPWRRPENRPCRCGKLYQPEQFMIEVCRGQSSIAACQNGIGVAYL